MVNNSTKINMGGREISLLFGLLQVKEFEIAMVGNLDLYFDAKHMITEAGLAKLIYTANQNNRFVSEGEGVTLEDIYEWLILGRTDKSVLDQIVEVVKVWQSSEKVQTWLTDIKKKTAIAVKELEKLKQPKKSKEKLTKQKPVSGRQVTGRKK